MNERLSPKEQEDVLEQGGHRVIGAGRAGSHDHEHALEALLGPLVEQIAEFVAEVMV